MNMKINFTLILDRRQEHTAELTVWIRQSFHHLY
ncbi:hypothetical protein Bhyg_01112 [Pseudolycoriella hygida]|uniref:Uncharacterized protein n=1 Tax=Pseudolycoriella hygida TaxID=35572 RepID=A0A9Q0N8Y8_9DIPT|nr:hypothetical protein Bhyg_01112 [Pseudolycoriella hygida]